MHGVRKQRGLRAHVSRGVQKAHASAHLKLLIPSIPRCSNSLNQQRIVSSFNNAAAISRQLRPSKSTNAFARRITREATDLSPAKSLKIQEISTETSMSRGIQIGAIRFIAEQKSAYRGFG
jgi:hypothetical protein